MHKIKYHSLLLKLSGEFLFEFNGQVEVSVHLLSIIKQIKAILKKGIKVGIVVGGGNICRGRQMQRNGVSRLVADNVGMLSTIINALVLEDYLVQSGVKVKVLGAFPVGSMVSEYQPSAMRKFVEDHHGEVLVFSGGTGNPLCSTDSAASLRAIQMNADIMVKLTNVSGVYSSDPNHDNNAHVYHNITHDEVISRNLSVMDIEACKQCKMFDIPIAVCDFRSPCVIEELVYGTVTGTLIAS